MPKFKSLKFRLARFGRKTDGSMTIEAVLWIPFFLLSFSLPFDVFMMLSAQTEAVRVVQDANRLTSIGQLATTADTESFVESRLASLASGASATATIDGNGMISTTVQFNSSQLALMGVFKGLVGITLTASADHMMEDFS